MIARWAGAAAVLVGLGLAAGVLYARERQAPLQPVSERFLYLRSGETARRVMLGFDALAADAYWIRTIQHFGRERRSARTSGRFELLEPLLDVTTTLDPDFMIAYRFGAVFLAMPPLGGPGRPDQAIQLLEKGERAHPERWQFAHDIGFIHFWYRGDSAAASAAFERAASRPRAPSWLGPLAATTRAQAGDRDAARRMLRELQSSEEEYIRKAAERALIQIDLLDVIDDLQRRVEAYHAQVGAYPAGWTDMVRAGLLPGIPVDPERVPFAYDADTHTVTLGPDSPLGPLPETLRRR